MRVVLSFDRRAGRLRVCRSVCLSVCPCVAVRAAAGRDTLEARLRDKKDMYKDLALSDALARELRRVPEEDQTIKVQ